MRAWMNIPTLITVFDLIMQSSSKENLLLSKTTLPANLALWSHWKMKKAPWK
jgi:hypothetical protein